MFIVSVRFLPCQKENWNYYYKFVSTNISWYSMWAPVFNELKNKEHIPRETQAYKIYFAENFHFKTNKV